MKVKDRAPLKSTFDITALPQYIDHTLLKPNAVKADIQILCEEALAHQFYTVCVNSSWVSDCHEFLKGSNVGISAVCGFPLGANASEVKAVEAAYSVEQGATEIDMVLPIGKLIEGNRAEVVKDIENVVKIVNSAALVKVIFETGLL